MINVNVLIMELRRSMKSFLIWSAALGGTLLLILLVYPMVEDLFEKLPDLADLGEIYDAFGGIPENIIEYFATEGGMILQFLSAIYATIIGFNAISRDEREHAADSIYTLPISRDTFYFTKLLSVIIQILVFSMIMLGFSILGIVIIDPLPLGDLIIFSLLNTVTLLMVVSISFSYGCIAKGNVKAASAMFIPLVMYILQMLSSLTENKWLVRLQYLTPFTFSNPVEILKDWEGLEWISLSVYIVLTIGLAILSLIRFRKKEFSL